MRDQYSPQLIKEYWGDPLKNMTPDSIDRARQDFELQGRNAIKLRAGAMRIVTATDTGQSRFLIGYFNHLDLESLVAIGMTPMETIVAATRDAAKIGHFHSGLVAAGKQAGLIVLD